MSATLPRPEAFGPRPVTRDRARAILGAMGWTLRRTDGAEWRVNRAGAPEEQAYYTTDLEDAIGTARAEDVRWAAAMREHMPDLAQLRRA